MSPLLRLGLACFAAIGVGSAAPAGLAQAAAAPPRIEPRPTAEPLRPAYHFTPPAHWMNDPNGLVYYRGIYHLFYQYHPNGMVWGPMHWGHAVSADLVHWQDRPIALAPDANGMIFSGSAVVDWHNTTGLSHDHRPPLLAIFTYDDQAARHAGAPSQSQGLAFSLDGGESWTKYAGNPVLRADAGQKDFRDPKVFWHQRTKSWIMALAVGDHAELFGSPDLEQWHRLSRFGINLGAHGGVWECPDLLEVPVAGSKRTKWVLIQSVNPGGPNGGSATQYFVGNFDGQTFRLDPGFAHSLRVHGPRWLDWGRDNYASVAWSELPKANRRSIIIGWMNNWDYGEKTPTAPWRSAMTLPRELSLHRDAHGSYSLWSSPLRELLMLEHRRVIWGKRNLAGAVDVPLEAQSVGQSHIDVSFAVPTGRTDVGIELSNRQGDRYRFSYNAAKKLFISDRTASGMIDFSPKFASIDTAPRLATGRLLHLSLYVDHTSVEAFADGGQTVMTTAVFPHAPYTRLRIFARHGSATMSGLRAAAIASAYPVAGSAAALPGRDHQAPD